MKKKLNKDKFWKKISNWPYGNEKFNKSNKKILKVSPMEWIKKRTEYQTWSQGRQNRTFRK
jgi:hypothetical protein